jgi:hypothetical protein
MIEKSPFSCGNFSDTGVQRGAERQCEGVMNNAIAILMLKRRTCGQLDF